MELDKLWENVSTIPSFDELDNFLESLYNNKIIF